jgi:hypothetical protein
MMTYTFYGRLNLEIEPHEHRGYERYFENEYLRIAERGRNKDVPTITVEIVKELPTRHADDLADRVRYKKLFTFEYLVRGLDTDDVVIYFKSHPVDKVYMNAIGVFVQAQVLEPIMYLKLLEQNVLFMHAAGAATETDGYLFPAHGGTGKTTMAMALLSHGFRLLGDDLLFVDVDAKTVHPYPRPLHLFTYNIRSLSGADVPFRYQAAIYAKNVLRFALERALRTEFLISTRVHADELFPENPYGSSVPYRKVCFLVKEGPVVRETRLTETSIPAVAEEIMESEDLNDSLYDMIGDPHKIDEVKKLEQKVIGDLLSHFDSLTYVNTRELDLGNLGSFVEEQLASQVPSGQSPSL